MDFDPGGSWAAIQGRETVTLRVKTGEGTYTDHAVDDAKRRVKEGFYSGDGLLSQADMPWHLWTEKLPLIDGVRVAPKENDLIIDGDDVSWAINKVQVQSLGRRYRCETTRI